MKRSLMVVGLVLSLAFISNVGAENNYVGAEKCSMCHKSDAKGNQYGHWLESKHAKAFEVLATEEAYAVAKSRGIEGNPQEAPECYKCHVTGYGVDESRFEESFKKEEGVQCEACHGAGSEYKTFKTMKDHEAAVAAGLLVPSKETCVKCHNEEAPTFKGFVFEEFLKKIAHPNPAK